MTRANENLGVTVRKNCPACGVEDNMDNLGGSGRWEKALTNSPYFGNSPSKTQSKQCSTRKKLILKRLPSFYNFLCSADLISQNGKFIFRTLRDFAYIDIYCFSVPKVYRWQIRLGMSGLHDKVLTRMKKIYIISEASVSKMQTFSVTVWEEDSKITGTSGQAHLGPSPNFRRGAPCGAASGPSGLPSGLPS